MIKVVECLDIELIEELRRKCLNVPLDDMDSFSYHIVIEVDGQPLGTVRLYHSRSKYLTIDNVAVVATDEHIREMLVRTMISRAVDLTEQFVEVKDCGSDIYSELGFQMCGENCYVADKSQIVFKCKCKG